MQSLSTTRTVLGLKVPPEVEGSEMPGSLSTSKANFIDGLYRTLMVDPKWSVRHEGGFSWWSYRLAQHVNIGNPVRVGNGALGYPVHIWTDVVQGIGAPEAALALVSSLNYYASLSALVWRAESATVREELTAVVFDETADDWVKTLSVASVLQNAAAHSRCIALSEAVHGSPAVSEHPRSGERPEMDDILNVPKDVIARAGKGRSKFAGEMLRRLPEFGLRPWLTANGTGTSFTAEFACVSDVTAA